MYNSGARIKLKKHKALYVFSSNDDKQIDHLIKNMRNALLDPWLKGKLKLIAFGDGFRVDQKACPFEAQLKELKEMGVIDQGLSHFNFIDQQ